MNPFHTSVTSGGTRLILFIHTCYDGFLKSHYQNSPALESCPYTVQKRSLLDAHLGDSDYYSKGMKQAGWRADDLIVNAPWLQKKWAEENGSSSTDCLSVMLDQIRQIRPDVVYIQDLSLATEPMLAAIRPHVQLICGQIASPLPAGTDLEGMDLLFSSFPHFVERFRNMGLTAYYQPLAFEPSVLDRISDLERVIPISFVGGISPFHGAGLSRLEEIARLMPFDIWGYGADILPETSPLIARHHGEAWGLQMFAVLASSRITLNRHIDVAENYANNMRLFEATGCGSLLITDYKDNLAELFDIGREVVVYRTPEECALLIRYYRAHPEEATAIARAGQARTLHDHTYKKRMAHTAEILERHLEYKRTNGSMQIPEMVSYGHQAVSLTDITATMESAWQSPEIPLKQRALIQYQLQKMYHGDVATHFKVLADLLASVVSNTTSILEIGCASGYYYEILEYLLNKRITYTGVDYSQPMIDLAKNYYPKASFYTADGSSLFFADRQFCVVISSCVLLHVKNWHEHIFETARVASSFVVASRTPICKNSPTTYMKKFAYGVETLELIFNEQDFIREFKLNRLEPVTATQYHALPEHDLYEVTYLFKRREEELSCFGMISGS